MPSRHRRVCMPSRPAYSPRNRRRDHPHPGLEQRDRPHRAKHGRTARHVVLHLLHAVCRLDGDAAGVEGDPFANQTEHRTVRYAIRFIAQNDQRWRPFGTLRHGCKRAHLQLVELFGGEHIPLQANLGGHLRCALAQYRRRELLPGSFTRVRVKSGSPPRSRLRRIVARRPPDLLPRGRQRERRHALILRSLR